MFEDFPDTDSATTEGTGVFEEVTEDAAAIDDVEGKEVDEVDVRAELDEGSKSNENDLNNLFLNIVFSLSLRLICNRNIHATNCVLQ